MDKVRKGFAHKKIGRDLNGTVLFNLEKNSLFYGHRGR